MWRRPHGDPAEGAGLTAKWQLIGGLIRQTGPPHFDACPHYLECRTGGSDGPGRTRRNGSHDAFTPDRI
jgi:hypothetical protein